MATRAPLTHIRPFVAALLCASLVGACASVPMESNRAGDPYASANRELRSHAAIVELAGGEVVAPARHVVVGSEETTWLGEDGPDWAPTQDVRRVIALRRPSRAWEWGVLAAFIGAAILVDEDVALDFALDVAVNLAFAYLEAGEGLPPEVGKIVYSAPAQAR
jgi:hypothetical protein